MDDEPRNNGIKTRKQMPEGRRFQPGNPGRPKGSRNKLAEAFTSDVLAHWEQHGPDAIHAAYQESPLGYTRMVASILPKEIKVEASPVEALSDDELASLIHTIRTAATASVSPRGRAGEASGPH